MQNQNWAIEIIQNIMKEQSDNPEKFKPLKQIKNIQTGTEKSANFMQTVPNSQFYTDLDMILESLKLVKVDIISINQIIKGLENTIERGYKIVKK